MEQNYMEGLKSQVLDCIGRSEEYLISTAGRLCGIESVSGAAAGADAPYGEGCRRALDEAISIFRQEGFIPFDDEGYACHGEMGKGEELIGIMCHLDTVPAGKGWDSDPFTLEERDGKLYARGIVDNKGPAAAVITAMKAIRECGIPLKRRVRLILGCDEENGMGDLEHYFAHNENPLWAFTPDAEFPVINCEKHIFNARIEKKITQGRLISLHSGERFNVVPDEAVCVIKGLTEDERAAVKAYCAERDLTVEISGEEITLHGVAAHASHPSLGRNAAAYTLDMLEKLALLDGEELDAVRFINSHIGFETDGESFGMKYSDEVSGALTMNMGIAEIKDGTASFCFDMRCPVTATREQLVSSFEKTAAAGSFATAIPHYADGIHVPADSELVKTLMSVYEAETGEALKPLAIGGGTYARQLPNRAVAFGPCFPGKVDMCHQRNEYMEKADLVRLARLVALAILELAA